MPDAVPNPILEMTSDSSDPIPLVELKQHLVLFVNDPPGPESARSVYDIYLARHGDRFTKYRPTLPSATLREWDSSARQRFEMVLLPQLRQRAEWGYGFSDGKPTDAWLFMFHGFRPFQEPDKASFYRFEFDWNFEPARLRAFAEELMNTVPFLSGYGGFLLQGRPGSKFETASYDRLFALGMRYWGCEVEDIEITSEQMKKGYKCVNWLTLLGEPFRSIFPVEIKAARSAAIYSSDRRFGTVLQAAEWPALGDRNRMDDLGGYFAIAQELVPMQIEQHRSFGGNRWTDENTMAWIRRFNEKHALRTGR